MSDYLIQLDKEGEFRYDGTVLGDEDVWEIAADTAWPVVFVLVSGDEEWLIAVEGAASEQEARVEAWRHCFGTQEGVTDEALDEYTRVVRPVPVLVG